MAAFRTNPGGRMLTKEEARVAVETDLFALKLTKPMTSAEREAFCQVANSTLNYESNADQMREIRAWTESWESIWLPEKAPGEHGNADKPRLPVSLAHWFRAIFAFSPSVRVSPNRRINKGVPGRAD